MTALYELAAEIQRLEAACEIGEENGPDNLDEFLLRLKHLEMEGDVKAANIIAWVISLEVEAEGISKEIARLTARKRARENKAQALREYLCEWLKGTGRTRFKTELATAYVNKPRERVEIDVTRVPDWPLEIVEHAKTEGALVEELVVKSQKLREAFPELWRDLPGVAVFEGTESLTIR